MQLTGDRFTTETAVLGNDLATLPDFPAEIRAPAGTLPGVSGFQIHFAAAAVYTPGDAVDALIVMNPAALKVTAVPTWASEGPVSVAVGGCAGSGWSMIRGLDAFWATER